MTSKNSSKSIITVNKVLDELVANTSNTLTDGSSGDYVVPVVPLSAIEKIRKEWE